MTDGTEPKPLPNRKRQLAGLLLALLPCYPLSSGAFNYATGRGWVPMWAVEASGVFYMPAHMALSLVPTEDRETLDQRYRRWNVEWIALGVRHAASD